MGKNLKKGTWPGVYNVNRVSNNEWWKKIFKNEISELQNPEKAYISCNPE